MQETTTQQYWYLDGKPYEMLNEPLDPPIQQTLYERAVGATESGVSYVPLGQIDVYDYDGSHGICLPATDKDGVRIYGELMAKRGGKEYTNGDKVPSCQGAFSKEFTIFTKLTFPSKIFI